MAGLGMYLTLSKPITSTIGAHTSFQITGCPDWGVQFMR